MQKMVRASMAALLVYGAAAQAAAVTPLGKVVSLLKAMAEKGQKELKEEQVTFSAFRQFCNNTAGEKTLSTGGASRKIALLAAEVQNADADSSRLNKEILSHDLDVASWTNATQVSSQVRTKELLDFQKLFNDYTQSISAIRTAIGILEKQNSNGLALTQLSAIQGLALIPDSAKKVINLFLMQGASSKDPSSLYALTKKSSIVDMLQKLVSKFIDDRNALEKKEITDRGAYELMTAGLKRQIEEAKTLRASKAQAQAGAEKTKASTQIMLLESNRTLAADSTYLAELQADCQQKAQDFQDRQSLRSQELEAIAKVLQLLSSEAVQSSSARRGLLQKASALAQLRSARQVVPSQQKALDFLRLQASKTHSNILAELADKAAKDPFVMVKKMIQDLITKLQNEAANKASHKEYCDKELKTNGKTRKEKGQALKVLKAEVDQLQVSVVQLRNDISDQNSSLAELDVTATTASQLRNKEAAQNKAALQDAKDGQVAVKQALQILTDFYAKAGKATALVQKADPAPVKQAQPYKGQADSKAVISLLEMVLSDFEKIEKEVSTAEAKARTAYDKLMEDSNVNKATMQQDVQFKTGKLGESEVALSQSLQLLQGTQQEVAAAETYFEKLKSSCFEPQKDALPSPEKRKEEIQSLRDALDMLK